MARQQSLQLGRFAEAIEPAEAAIQIAESMPYQYDIGRAYWAGGHLHLAKGNWDKARVLLERGIAVSRALNEVS